MRASVHGNHAVSVHPLEEHDDLSGTLEDLDRSAEIAPRDALERTTIFGLDVLQLGRSLEVDEVLPSLLDGPRLERNSSVGRIDDDLLPQPDVVRGPPLHLVVFRVAASLLETVPCIRRVSTALPGALNVGLAIRQA